MHPKIQSGTVACTWLGQAGYLITTREGLTVMVDPYFSDECERLEGLKRLFAPPIAADQLQPDILLVTHGHLDHFDEPTIRTFASVGRTVSLPRPPALSARQSWDGDPRSFDRFNLANRQPAAVTSPQHLPGTPSPTRSAVCSACR